MSNLFNSFSLIIQFAAVVFSLALGIRIFLKKDRQSLSNGLLFLFLIFNGYAITLFLIVSQGLIEEYWYLYRTSLPTSLMVPALVYLYLRSLINDESSFKKNDSIHLVPFILGAVQYLPYYLSSIDFKKTTVATLIDRSLEFDLNIGVVSEDNFAWIRAGISLIYVALIINLLRCEKIQLISATEKSKLFEKRIVRWIKIFGYSFSFNHIAIALYLILSSTSLMAEQETFLALTGYVISLLFNGTLIYYSSYLLINPETLVGLDHHSRWTITKDQSINHIEHKDELHNDYEQLKSIIIDQKMYLNASLKLQDVAHIANIPIRRASFVINNLHNKNFNQMINEFRVNEAVKKIEDGFLDEYTLDALWQEVGFSNKTTFYSTFKQHLGITPGQFVANTLSSTGKTKESVLDSES